VILRSDLLTTLSVARLFFRLLTLRISQISSTSFVGRSQNRDIRYVTRPSALIPREARTSVLLTSPLTRVAGPIASPFSLLPVVPVACLGFGIRLIFLTIMTFSQTGCAGLVSCGWVTQGRDDSVSR
jgi:hypothetical protein